PRLQVNKTTPTPDFISYQPSQQRHQRQPPGISRFYDCVSSLRTSLSFLESSVTTLGTGVQDFPRLTSVLKTVRHYELIPQPTLAAAEASLRDEIGPFVALLLDRADKHLERQARRIETLKARAELNAGRLSRYPVEGEGVKKEGPQLGGGGGGSRGKLGGSGKSRQTLDGGAGLRAKVVRQRKEALQYSVERLELEVLQKERELRVRVEQA
ncbi:Spc19-domain-containing protein, partial [Chaetomium tenue]